MARGNDLEDIRLNKVQAIIRLLRRSEYDHVCMRVYRARTWAGDPMYILALSLLLGPDLNRRRDTESCPIEFSMPIQLPRHALPEGIYASERRFLYIPARLLFPWYA